jgi:tissue factor pathway inhibitor
VGKTEVTEHCNTDYCQTEDGGRIECDGLCDVDPFTSLPYCSPSCDINNGGCADDEECVLETVFCIRAPCPPLVSCRPKENPCNLIDCAPGTTCRVNENTGAGECIKDICALEVEPGPCRGSIPSYFFNFKSGQCEKFIYGGCGGNENRFSLLEEHLVLHVV